MRYRAAWVLVVVLAAISAGVERAQAGLRVCNLSSINLVVAVGYVDRQQGWVSEGWWTVDTHDCKLTISSPLNNRFYYLYAKGKADHPNVTFSGATPFCVKHDAFKLYQAQYGKDTEADCSKAGLFSLPFFKADTNNAPDHTVRLNGEDTTQAASPSPAPQPAPVIPPRAPQPPVAPPAGGGAGSACQRFPNLC